LNSGIACTLTAMNPGWELGMQMNILIVNQYFFNSDGSERYMFSVVDLLEAEGHKYVPN
jgi:hypothetical protein